VSQRRRLILILGALSAFAPLSIDMYLPAFPTLARDLHSQPSAVQLTLTSFVVGLALGQLVAGPLSDALGRRRPLVIGLAGYIIASLLCAFAVTVPELILLRLLQGLTGAAAIVIARAIVRDLYTGADAARFFSLLILVNGLGPILAPVIGAQVMRVTSWRGVFFVLATIGAVLLVATFMGLGETLPRERRRTGGAPDTLRTFARLLRDRGFVGYALAGGFGYAGLFAYIGASPFVLQDIYGLSPQGFSLVFAINALGIMVTSQTGARVVHRSGPEALLGVGLAMSALGAIGLVTSAAFHLGLPGVLLSFFALVSSIGFILPNGVALALADHARVAGTASALIGMTQYLLGGAIAPLVGVAGSHTAIPVTVVISATVTAAIASLVIARTTSRRKRAA
jgi:DHA1 family bicyclomycin/chloramphenicol resistance-like MFS transporter